METLEFELRQPSVAAQQFRLNLYGPIHKALRAQMTDALLGVGRMDCGDQPEVTFALDAVVDLLDALRAHVAHENEFMHPAINAARSNGAQRTADDHEEHLASIVELEMAVQRVRDASGRDRDFAAALLYRQLALFLAENLQHMHIEETANNAILWENYSDSELMALHERLLSSIPPEAMQKTMRWMVPAMSHPERAHMMLDMQAKAPPSVFAAVVESMRNLLSHRDFDKLVRALGLPQVPGLVDFH